MKQVTDFENQFVKQYVKEFSGKGWANNLHKNAFAHGYMRALIENGLCNDVFYDDISKVTFDDIAVTSALIKAGEKAIAEKHAIAMKKAMDKRIAKLHSHKISSKKTVKKPAVKRVSRK